MNNSSLIHFRQYAALFIKLLMPLNVLRWILAFTAVLWGLALVLQASNDWSFLLVIAMAITGLMAFLLLMLIPNQVIALASSRPVSLLSNSRFTLLMSLIVSAAVISWGFYSTIMSNQESSQIPSLSLVVWLIVSLLLQLCVFIRSRWENNWFFVFVAAWVWMKLGLWLTGLHPLLLVSALVVSWLVFARWWLQWRPKEYRPNIMASVINDSQQAAAARNAGFLFQSGKADSWMGSRFFGASDGWRSRSARLIVGGIIFLIAPIPASILMGQDQFQLLIHSSLILLVMFLAASVAQGMAGNFTRNLRHIWLYSSGSRQNILNIAWKLYVREMGIFSLVCIGLGVLVELIWGQWRGTEIWLYSAVTLLLMNTGSFYLAWWVYLRSQGSVLWCNWIGGVAVMLLMMLFIATGLLFPLPFDWQGISITWVWLPQLILLGLLYKPVRLGFSRMNFVRVA